MNKTIHDSETLAEGQQVITAAAFIYHRFDHTLKVFLAKRAATKQFLPNVYELPGGHIDFGEDLIQGLKREVHEEFSKDIAVEDLYYAFTYTNQVKKSHSIELVYLATFLDGIDNIVTHPEDHSEYLWSDQDTAIQLYKENDNNLELPAIQMGFELAEKLSQ